MGPGLGLEDARDEAPRGAERGACEQGQGKMQERREVRQRESGQGRPGGAEYDLPLSADVEEAGAKGESYSQSRHYEGSRRDDRLGERPEGDGEIRGLAAAKGDGEVGRAPDRSDEERAIGLGHRDP